MVPASVLQRTFLIKYDEHMGTCFTFDLDNRQYLITAKHVIQDISTCDTIHVMHNKNWLALPCKLVGHAVGKTDITVLALDRRLSPTHALSFSDPGFYLSQEAYFLGFPYGLRMDIGLENNFYPVPLVKKCIISGFFTDEQGVKHIYLDGHNNPGFSGGPVVYSDPGRKEMKVAAVISGFRFEDAPIFVGDEKTPLSYRDNTGIIVSYDFRHAIEAIQANPVGYHLHH